MRVAAIQMRSTTSPAENVAAMRTLVGDASAGGARYVQTPEMTGLIEKNPKALFGAIKPQEDDPVFAEAAQLAEKYDLWLHVGSTPIDLGNGFAANRAGLFSPSGELTASYDKIHMFDVDLDNGESWRESAIYTPGSQSVVAPIDGAIIGFGICYDVRFPHLFRTLSILGAHILTIPAAFTRQTGQAHWHALLRSRAIENGAYVVASAQGGQHGDGRETYGHSLIIDPWGNIVAEKNDDAPGIIFANLDMDAVTQARAKIPNLQNARHFDGLDQSMPKASL